MPDSNSLPQREQHDDDGVRSAVRGELLPTVAGIALDDSTIRTAVGGLSDSATAEAAYGHISTWRLGG